MRSVRSSETRETDIKRRLEAERDMEVRDDSIFCVFELMAVCTVGTGGDTEDAERDYSPRARVEREVRNRE